MDLLKILLLPFSLLYGCIVSVRNKMYDWGILSSTQFDIPTISVGNLSVGGTGKTPHIEYLLRLLKPEFKMATLSRGYGRKTEGYKVVEKQSTAIDIGDEPLQFKSKFEDVEVVVDADRVHGIKTIEAEFPEVQSILLDDAFQHRAVTPGLSIVLSDFRKLYYDDYMVPTGSLREFRSGISRANIIIVTKCPTILVPLERRRIINDIKPLPHQTVYFSSIEYGEIISINTGITNPVSKTYYAENNYTILLVTGIANTEQIERYLKSHVSDVIPLTYSDHHTYTKKDVDTIQKKFNGIPAKNKIIITTEKDAMRLKAPEFETILNSLPVFYMPIEMEFFEQDKKAFNEQILNYVRSNQKRNSVYTT